MLLSVPPRAGIATFGYNKSNKKVRKPSTPCPHQPPLPISQDLGNVLGLNREDRLKKGGLRRFPPPTLPKILIPQGEGVVAAMKEIGSFQFWGD